ncbi:PREDICTED: class I histocompatibility antigen, F10 alpha chain-like [Lepidothrix coronata]|uniref:Class I histocompatibility antigen, F10 alpha chain-like n=1 Tax=Lepidothrix coronata TaxID=321398 RepID=A0A6J0GSS6_9PASS|nr:PREDICTED: class I histocompatibility antigen, F10 alpha chain-like [Lepidothrix coronata]
MSIGMVLHSLRYLDVTVSEPSPGIPQYLSMEYVDGIPICRYDSERGQVEPLTLWMAAGTKPGYWDGQTQIAEGNQLTDAASLETVGAAHPPGLHIRQQGYGCDLLSDGSICGSHREAYNGRDFISFELGSRSFVVADGAARITKRKWEHSGVMVERKTHYLENICPEALQKFVGYGREVLEHKDPPDVHVSGKEEHGILMLSCHVHTYGFYPGMIGINCMKGDEMRDQETEWGGIVPNSDGTFHSWARIEALPGEREQYRCRVEHAGMLEPGIFAWELESVWNSTLVFVAVSVIAAIIIISLMGVGVWKLRSGKREGNGYDPAPTTGIMA